MEAAARARKAVAGFHSERGRMTQEKPPLPETAQSRPSTLEQA
jgi:hypothetical protein